MSVYLFIYLFIYLLFCVTMVDIIVSHVVKMPLKELKWYHCDTCWCNMIQRSKDCHNETIISSLQELIKRPLMDIACDIIVYWFFGP